MLYNVTDLNGKILKKNLTIAECENYINSKSEYLLYEKVKCSICEKELEGYGNNPQPISDDCTDRCCDDCNWEKVIPARINQLINNK